jgi:hypothetical protein
LRFRTLLEAHHHLDFGAKGFAITFDGFFAVPVEEEVRLNGSVVFCRVHRFGLLFRFVASCLIITFRLLPSEARGDGGLFRHAGALVPFALQ